ncbi:MAG: hypothetical protein WBA10_18625 [Elainellaceae cyanobacterium]
MFKHRKWVPALLCATAAASGLAGGYAGTRLVTDSQSSDEPSNHALLGREQAFPPSSNWPSHTLQSGRDVLFEDEPSNSEWLSKPARSAQTASRNSASPAKARSSRRAAEEPTTTAVEPALSIQSDVDLSGDSTWGEPSTAVADERSPNAASFAGTSEIEAFTEPSTPPASATVDFGSGEPPIDVETLEVDQGGKMKRSSADWAQPGEPQSEAIDNVSSPDTL